MLHTLTAVLSIYLILRLIVPLRLPRWLKALLGLILLACGMKLLVARMMVGSLTPEWSREVTIGTGFAHGVLVLLAVFCLVKDLLSLLCRLWRKLLRHKPVAPRFSNNQWAAGMLVFALLLGTTAVWQAVKVPELRRLSLTLDRLPKNLDGLRIVQISDLHVCATFPRAWVEQVVAKVNALKPDLVVMTGDIADGLPSLRTEDMLPLAGLRAPLGVFSCTGNHEYYWGFKEWMDKCREVNITPLLNTHVVLNTKGEHIVLAGVADEASRRFGFAAPDIGKALDNAPADIARILLAHRPQLIEKAAAANVDLQLSGHTHGGQIIGLNYIIKKFNGGFLSGMYRIKESQLYVSTGAGLWAGFPLRLFVPSEIVEITLHSKTG